MSVRKKEYHSNMEPFNLTSMQVSNNQMKTKATKQDSHTLHFYYKQGVKFFNVTEVKIQDSLTEVY